LFVLRSIRDHLINAFKYFNVRQVSNKSKKQSTYSVPGFNGSNRGRIESNGPCMGDNCGYLFNLRTPEKGVLVVNIED